MATKKFIVPIESNVPDGTAPMVVNSQTSVLNLNADLLDGQHGSYYLDYNNLTNLPAGGGAWDGYFKGSMVSPNNMVFINDTYFQYVYTGSNSTHFWVLPFLSAAPNRTVYVKNAGSTQMRVIPNGNDWMFDVTSAVQELYLQPGEWASFSSNGTTMWYVYKSSVSTSGGGGGTVTSVSAGNGMTFNPINSSGAVTLGVPGLLSDTTTNAVQANSHTHAITTYTPTASGAISVSGGKVLGSALSISHSTNNGYKHIPANGSVGQILWWSSDGTAVWGDAPTGGGVYVLPTASASVLGGIKVGSGLSINAFTGVLSATGGGSGTVTSIGMSVPSGFSVSPTSINTSGTFNISLSSQTYGKVLIAPIDSSGVPTFRRLTSGDLPTLPYDNYEYFHFKVAGFDAQIKGTNAHTSEYKGIELVAGTNITMNGQSSNGYNQITISATGGTSGGVSNVFQTERLLSIDVTLYSINTWYLVGALRVQEDGTYLVLYDMTFYKQGTGTSKIALKVVKDGNDCGMSEMTAYSQNPNIQHLSGHCFVSHSGKGGSVEVYARANTSNWHVSSVVPVTSDSYDCSRLSIIKLTD